MGRLKVRTKAVSVAPTTLFCQLKSLIFGTWRSPPMTNSAIAKLSKKINDIAAPSMDSYIFNFNTNITLFGINHLFQGKS